MLAKGPQHRPNRVKVFRPKVVTGCKTCKLRRIKCDEFKPTCKRCSSTGRQCGGVGYTEGVHNSEPITPNSETLAMSRSPESTPLSSPTIYLPSLHSLQLAQERRSFQFFTDRTVIDIANGLDTKFWHNWKRHLLQAAYHEPAVRHAAVALAALHEQFELGERSDLETGLINCDNQFALQQYVTAIGLLRNPIRKKKGKIADVALITCILFVCFEQLRGHHGAAIGHIDGGVNILSNIKEPGHTSDSDTVSASNSRPPYLTLSSSPYVPLATLSRLFVSLDSQAAGFTQNRRPIIVEPSDPSAPSDFRLRGYSSNIPLSFQDVDDARDHLHYIAASGFKAASAEVAKSPDPAQLKLALDLINSYSTIRLNQWSKAFEALVSATPIGVNFHGLQVLRMHRIVVGLNFSIDQIRAKVDECVWDNHMSAFRAIINIAESIALPESTSLGSKKRFTVFSMDSGTMVGLYTVATKCRDGFIRRQALDLMRREDRQEGVWNSILTSRVAQRQMEIEEEGLGGGMVEAGDIPDWRRVTGLEVSFDPSQRRAKVHYVRRKENRGPVLLGLTRHISAAGWHVAQTRVSILPTTPESLDGSSEEVLSKPAEVSADDDQDSDGHTILGEWIYW